MKHGYSRRGHAHPLYRKWTRIKDKGIGMCAEWMNDGPYSPENCKFSTMKEQCITKRIKRKLTSSDVVAIRALLATGRTRRSLAYEYEVSESLISLISLNKAWKLKNVS